MTFIRSLIRRRRQTKEQNATARDVPAMSLEMSALALEEPWPPRAPETSDVVDAIRVVIVDQKSEGHASQDDNGAAAPPRSDSDASASFSTPPPAASEWTCERCTFMNGYNSAACEMCGASKPPSADLARPLSLAHPSADPLGQSGSHADAPSADSVAAAEPTPPAPADSIAAAEPTPPAHVASLTIALREARDENERLRRELRTTHAPPADPPPGGPRNSPRLVDDEGNPVSDSDEDEVGSAGANPTTPQDAPLSPARPKQATSL